jgi:hypothetical protein
MLSFPSFFWLKIMQLIFICTLEYNCNSFDSYMYINSFIHFSVNENLSYFQVFIFSFCLYF